MSLSLDLAYSRWGAEGLSSPNQGTAGQVYNTPYSYIYRVGPVVVNRAIEFVQQGKSRVVT